MVRIPSCFWSNPSPQEQAENCCHDCHMRKDCVGRPEASTRDRPTSQDLREMRTITGLGMQECRRFLNARWRKSRLAEIKSQCALGPNAAHGTLKKIVEFLEVADRDYSGEQ